MLSYIFQIHSFNIGFLWDISSYGVKVSAYSGSKKFSLSLTRVSPTDLLAPSLTYLQTIECLALSSISPLFEDRFGRSLRVCCLEFDKEAISDV